MHINVAVLTKCVSARDLRCACSTVENQQQEGTKGVQNGASALAKKIRSVFVTSVHSTVVLSVYYSSCGMV